MCGIAGFLDPTGRVRDPAETLTRMMDALRHRGPDDSGSFLEPGAALGHRRLSIIDLASGRQPIGNEDGTIQVVLNGEIYNFQALRAELVARGHVFRTHSDTEVLVHLYEEVGEALPTKLVGMFAIAIWDRPRRRLLLTRDRMGQKPLYVAHGAHGLVFGSELRALMAHPAVERQLDLAGLRRYLLYDAVPAPGSILKGVSKLEPGETLVWENGAVRRWLYWDLRFDQLADQPASDAEAIERFLTLLRESVRLQLVADVPLGVFLSGGLDSSTVLATMAELTDPKRIQTFSVGFSDPSFDESGPARLVAEHFGCAHHEERLEPQTMLELLPDILASLSEPLADASIVPTYLLSRFTRRHVTVALAGDGGDELLLGYPTFQAHKAARVYGQLPGWFHRHVALPLAERLPVSTANISLDFKIRRFLRGMDYPAMARHFVWIGSLDPGAQRGLLSRQVLAETAGLDVFDTVATHAARCRPRDDFDRLSYLYSKIYMQDDILAKVDRASMAVGLEARAPLLDHRLVEFLAGLETPWKLRGWTMKYLLKRAMRGRLPESILRRPKKGFGIPLARWLQGPLKGWAQSLLEPRALAEQGLFEPNAVAAMFQEHLAGRRDHRKPLFALLVFQLWYRNYLSPGSASA